MPRHHVGTKMPHTRWEESISSLQRLEKQGWVTAEWTVSENKQRARTYRMTPSGRKQLTAERSRWAKLVEAMAGVLDPEGQGNEA